MCDRPAPSTKRWYLLFSYRCSIESIGCIFPDMSSTALVQTQAAAAGSGERIVLVLEGRDGAGKDSAIKRITRYLAVRARASSAGGN